MYIYENKNLFLKIKAWAKTKKETLKKLLKTQPLSKYLKSKLHSSHLTTSQYFKSLFRKSHNFVSLQLLMKIKTFALI